ncbi:hypothetical protein X798_03309 [Onchocerca flexuosa]|uniref:Uncharacterized protein n=1 Tax=Onchocerca flexuosa TaxID=387005 RepID=A0A238BXI2_9BILA|nr:hypothetical protein X798_03309 [Onchocerca flexuosa]
MEVCISELQMTYKYCAEIPPPIIRYIFNSQNSCLRYLLLNAMSVVAIFVLLLVAAFAYFNFTKLQREATGVKSKSVTPSTTVMQEEVAVLIMLDQIVTKNYANNTPFTLILTFYLFDRSSPFWKMQLR